MDNQTLENMIPIIKQYCLKITRNCWHAEDLAQEVIMKVIQVQKENPHKQISKSFLYRMALNKWLDHVKKQKMDAEPFENDSDVHSCVDTQFVTRELLEVLAHRLTARDMVILLFMDIFGFTAKETARFLDAHAGTLQVALGRARKRLKKLASQISDNPEPSRDPKGDNLDNPISRKDFDALVDAFRSRNFVAMRDTYLKLARNGVRLQHIGVDAGRNIFYFHDPDGNVIMVTS